MARRNQFGGYGTNQYGPSTPNGYNGRPMKKRSGAKTRTYSPQTGKNAGNTQYLTTGWKATRNGLIAVKCVTTEKSALSERGWFGHVACTLTNTSTGESNFHWGTMEKSTGKVVIDRINWTVNPRANNGGYCGTFLGKK